MITKATSTNRWARVAGAFLGSYALIGGVVSFTGWVFDLQRLTDWDNNGISIQPNTCIAVMAAGTALIALAFQYRRLATVLGILVALIGGSVLFQYLSRADAAAKQIAVTVTAPDELIVVEADPLRMQQVVWNLLNNAVKFTPSGGKIDISLKLEDQHVSLMIKDTGVGIDPEFQPHVFEMFRQADSSSIRRHGGMGIGLALVQQLIQLHEGTLAVDSDGSGHGATFTIQLPARKQKDFPIAAQVNLPKLELLNLRVLVVDDSEDTTGMLQRLLEMNGARVRTASSGAEALRAISEHPFDVIISDVSMPEMDGFEFLRQLRSRPEHRAVPVLALTGFGRPEDIERARNAGFFSHITKPFDLQKLSATLQTVNGWRRGPS